MASLVSDAEKASWSSEFTNIHDTFARPVTMYKVANRVNIATTDEFQSIYRASVQGPNFDFATQPVEGIFDVRVKWLDPFKEANWSEISPKLAGNICRLKIKEDALEFLRDAQPVYVDGRACEIVGVTKPHGLFNIDFYTVFLREKELEV